MLAYNKTWFSNLLIIEQVQQKTDEGYLTTAELNNIKTAYPVGFYTPGFIGRMGLFALTLFISAVACLLLSLIFEPFAVVESYFWFLFLGTANYAALETLVRNKHHFRSGVDDALLWVSFVLLSGSIYWAVKNEHDVTLYTSASIFVLGCLFTMRFNDRLTGAISYLSAVSFIYFMWQKLGTFGLSTMPLILILLSAALYRFFKQLENKQNMSFYGKVILVVEMLSLLTFYLSGNYYAVAALNDVLQGAENNAIPLSWAFWLWTTLIPIVYIFAGIRRKSHLFLRLGMFLVVIAVLTIRNYYHLMPTSYVLSLCGSIMLTMCWWLNNYLRKPEHEFTLKETPTFSDTDDINVESLIISETMPHGSNAQLHTPASDSRTNFGGGSFGGGGASSEF
jgi:uncharacterized membrane protein YgcG